MVQNANADISGDGIKAKRYGLLEYGLVVVSYILPILETSDVQEFYITPTLAIQTSCPIPAAKQGVAYYQDLAASGGATIYAFNFDSIAAIGSGISYAWVAAGLPSGLSVVGQAIQGTPQQSGTFPFQLTVTDSFDTVTKQCSITVAPPAMPAGAVAVGCPASSAVQNQPYKSPVSASGGVSPYTFTLASGSLPAGLSLTGSTVAGTPTATGASPFRLKATGANGVSGERDCSIVTTTPASFTSTPPADVVTPPPAPTVTITTACPLPAGKTGTQYNTQLTAQGGTGPYKWSIAGGTFTPGLTLQQNGSIVGSPGYGGDYGFILRATDVNTVSGTKSCGMTVAGPGGLLTILRMSPPAAIAGSGPVLVRFQGTGYESGMKLMWDFESPEPVELAVSVANSEDALVTIPRDLLTDKADVLVAFRAPGSIARFSNAVRFSVVAQLELTQTCPLPEAAKGREYAQKLEARGGFPPYRFTVANRRLPAGLTMSGEEVTGTTAEEGVFEFFMVVTDAAKNTAGKNCSIRVPGGIAADQEVVTFTAQAAGPPVPGQELSVFSITPGVPFRVDVTTWSGGGWLKADLMQATTPALLHIRAGEAPEGGHLGEIALTPSNGSPTVRVQVIYRVRPAPRDRLTASPGALQFTAARQGAPPSPQVVNVFNEGAADISYRTIVTYLNGNNWLEVTPPTGQVTNKNRVRMRVTPKSSELEEGTYRALLRLEQASGPPAPPVIIPVTLGVSAAGETMRLSAEGFSFRAAAGRPFQITQKFEVFAAGGQGFNFRVKPTVLAGGNWLRVFPSEGTSTPGSAGGSEIIIDPNGLEAGEHLGEVVVEADGAANAPRSIFVALQLVAEGGADTAGPIIRPGALLFTTAPGVGGLAKQRVSVQNLSANSAGFDFALQGDVRAFRITVPEGRTLGAGQTLNVEVEAVTTGLAAGVYRGALAVRASSERKVRQVDLLLVVANGASPNPKAAAREAAGCRPTRLLPATPTQPLGFVAPGGLPLPLEVRVIDDCGDALTEGAVTVSFSTGAPAPIGLTHLGNGRWSGTWPVQQISATPVLMTVAAEDLDRRVTGTVEVGGNVAANDGAPLIDLQGVVSTANVKAGLPLAAGALARVSGQNLVDGTASATPPLPKTLANARLIIGGREVPLLYTGLDVNGTLLVAGLPFDLKPNLKYQAAVYRGRRRSNFVDVLATQVQPAVFTVDRSGSGQGLLYGGAESAVVADALNPVARGERVQILVEGLGQVTPEVAAGQAAPIDAPAAVIAPVAVTIGGMEAQVESAVLAPEQVGIYVITAVVPSTIEAGNAVEVTVTAGGVTSEPVTIAVR